MKTSRHATLTSDVSETAMNIGYSCSMLRDDMEEVFVITGATSQDVQHQLRWSCVIYLPRHTPAAEICLHNMAKNANRATNVPSAGRLKVTF